MAVNNQSKYPLQFSAPKRRKRVNGLVTFAAATVVIVGGGVILLPQAITIQTKYAQAVSPKNPKAIAEGSGTPFPISVNPATKSIVASPEADALFNHNSSLTASAGVVSEVLDWIASTIASADFYQPLAAVDGHLINVSAGDRKEQILARLVSALNWSTAQQQEFLASADSQTPGITDGMFAPGNYVVDNSMTPANVASLMSIRFNQTVLSHYSSSTQAIVPLGQALTVASLIERETGGTKDMRYISGIIWNRLFSNMNLQIDASLQYAKGKTAKGSWWSTVVPKDKYVKSPYNTYAHPGLPPGPIAEPSTAAVIAALNPIQTSCVFYFHDRYGNFHCSTTYAQHVALLKKYYGQGK
jgi:cell division protein YceG involved in septum cleavage